MISRQAKELLTTNGFIRFFFSMIRQNPDITQTGAYEKAEEEYKKNFGERKYSNYDSFRKMKSRYLKRRAK
jgi:hypothetical protein